MQRQKGRPGSMSGVDFKLAKKEERSAEREKKRNGSYSTHRNHPVSLHSETFNRIAKND